MNHTVLDLAKERFLTPADMDWGAVEKIITRVAQKHIDYADLYFQASMHEGWMLEDGRINSGSFDIHQGAGIRAISGEQTGFAYSDHISLPALLSASDSARAIAADGKNIRVGSLHNVPVKHSLYPSDNPISTLQAEDKIRLLQRIDQIARAADPCVREVMASLNAVQDLILIASSDGVLTADIRPMVRLGVHVIVERNGRKEQGSSGGGGRFTIDRLADDAFIAHHAKEAVRQALVNLEADEAPAGEMVVVLGPGWPGILLHEAVGHGLEGDFIRKGSSAFCGKVGEKVASSLCTVVDNGTIDQRRGSLNIDDEGTPTQNTVLIENGILKGFLQDKLNARLTGSQPTGNGRRESFAHLPMPRMTNTYMLGGAESPEEIIASVKDGLYAVQFGGGQVDITSGKFVFSASEAYRIKNGRLENPVRGATLIGNGPEVLKQVSMVGNDLKLDEGIGTCGKEGQSVPVGVGQPTLRIDKLTVGGTQTH